MKDKLGPQSLAAEDKMLLDAQVDLGIQVGSQAADSFLSGGIGGLTNFAKKQVVSNATTAAAYNIDKTFKPRARVSLQMTYMGGSGTRYVAHGTTYKPRDRDASLRFKRARYSSYRMMRAR